MPSATFTLFDKYQLSLHHGRFNFNSSGGHTFKLALTNSAPSVANDDELADITEVSYTNCSSRTLTISSSTQTTGDYKAVFDDLTLTATGTVGPFRYLPIYDDTASGDPLVGYLDYGSAITLQNGDTFPVNFDGSAGLITASNT